MTGSRTWSDAATVRRVLEALVDPYRRLESTVVHGACRSGVDAMAGAWAREKGVPVEEHPADWAAGRRAGPLRNQAMVDLGADLVLAFLSPCV